MNIWNKLVGLAFLAITGSVLVTSCSDSSDAAAPAAGHVNFVGTYYGESGETFIIHADGTQSSVVANMFAQDAEFRGGRRATPAQGVWEQVSDNAIRGMNVRFQTEPFGDNFPPNGLTMKAHFTMVSDEPVDGSPQTYTLKDVMLEFFTAEQNPFTDEPIIVVPFEGQKAWRLEIDETP